MSSERSISPEPLPRGQSNSSVIVLDDKETGGRGGGRQTSSSTGQKRRRESPPRSQTPPSPRSPVSNRSRSRSSADGSKSPVGRATNVSSHRSPSPTAARSSSSTKKRSRRKSSDVDAGRNICSICSRDVEASKRLYGVLDNCDHVFCYECIVSWKRSKYSNAESESCPVCKVRSAFITPSKHWYENKDEKHRIIKKHKGHLKTLPCRYYLRHGFCRYSDRCFYDHEEAARQYRQQNQHSRDRGDRDRGDRDRGDRDRGDRGDRDRHRERNSYNGGNRSHHYSPSPPPQSSSSGRHASARYRERPY